MGKFQPGNKTGPRIQPGQVLNPHGRPPKLKNLPKDVREQIMRALWHAVSLPDQKTAAEYLQKTAEELPKYGYLIQCYASGMMGKNGIDYLADLLDRIIGKPKQAADVNVNGQVTGVQIVVGDKDTADALHAAIDANAEQ